MRFDDRLLTVLNLPAEDRHDAAVRWRQLVDLVARAGANVSTAVIDKALSEIRTEAPNIDEMLRAGAARSIAGMPIPFGLLEYFASERLGVSAPILAAATLDPLGWQIIHGAADEESRRFIETVHPEVNTTLSPQPEPAPIEPVASPPVVEVPAYAPPSLHDVVERIERRRILREESASAPEVLPIFAEPAALFRWECGPDGDIAWVEGVPRGAMIGRSIAKPRGSDGDRVDQSVARAFSARAPFRDGTMVIGSGGLLGGDWKISGVPAFHPADGRFAGYRGIALREAAVSSPPRVEEMPEALADPDALRELVHEIKTPLNAIIGFAEIIEGQYLGPADRGYRDRAADIVRHARQLASGVDDLDFAAKIQTAAESRNGQIELNALIERRASELNVVAAKRGVDLIVSRARDDVRAAVQPELADRLVTRLAEALIRQAGDGERLDLVAGSSNGTPRLSVTRPISLRGIPDDDLFEPGRGPSREGGFALRLVRGLARIAGGDLVGSRDAFTLYFPRR